MKRELPIIFERIKEVCVQNSQFHASDLYSQPSIPDQNIIKISQLYGLQV